MDDSSRLAVSQTVKVLITDEGRNVLLVQERGTPRDQYDDDPSRGKSEQWIKEPGWGLPGGKVEGSVRDIRDAIRNLMSSLGMDHSAPRIRRALNRCRRQFDERVALTAVKECLEEAGVFIMPVSQELWASPQGETIWLVRAVGVTTGRRYGGDAKILGTAWHPAGRLPQGTYPRTRAMVRTATYGRRKTAQVAERGR